jgi:type I restriction enzyme M protein
MTMKTHWIKSIQDIMRKDVGVDGDAQRIAQLVWMIFLKIIDDKEMEYERINSGYRSPLPEQLRWRYWAAPGAGLTGNELLDFINNDLFRTLKDGNKLRADKKGRMINEIFADLFNYMKSGTLLRQIIDKINELDFHASKDRHLLNDIYEGILGDLQNAGNSGEYYTPRAITRFMVEMVNPKLGETVLDPACGTGGFLVNVIDYLFHQEVKNVEDREQMQNSILGIEKKPLPYLLSITNLMLHDIEAPQIKRDNLLSYPLQDLPLREKVDIVFMNPPFGGSEEDKLLSHFPADLRTKETADLFLVAIVTLLKERGRAGIILPDGSLFGEGNKINIRKRLLSECNLHTIVRLPAGVFSPYAKDVATNLLFFEKGTPTQEVWYFEHPLPVGMKKYSKLHAIRYDEFQLEKNWWQQREENKYAWKVTLAEIKENNYNLDFKNPHRKSFDNSLSSAHVLIQLEENLKRSMNLLQEIKGVLSSE